MNKIVKLDTVDSTNKYAKMHLLKLDNWTIVYTNNQTDGKGRMTRKWISSSNSLTFSLVLKDRFSRDNFSTISLLAGAATFLTLSKYIKKGLAIKWPNDLMYEDSKIAGILLEGVSYGDKLQGVVVGIGININNTQDEFISLDRKVTSLRIINNVNYKLDTILEELIDNFKLLYLDAKKGNDLYYKIVSKNNYLDNKEAYAIINGEEKRVKIIRINEDNSIRVAKNDEIFDLSSGEISLHYK